MRRSSSRAVIQVTKQAEEEAMQPEEEEEEEEEDTGILSVPLEGWMGSATAPAPTFGARSGRARG